MTYRPCSRHESNAIHRALTLTQAIILRVRGRFLKNLKSFGALACLGGNDFFTTLTHGGFRVKTSIACRLGVCKRRILRRLARANRVKYQRFAAGMGPVLNPSGVKYELADKTRGIAYGGVGLMIKLAREVGLVEAIDRRLRLFRSAP
jgi:hypothetical protein